MTTMRRVLFSLVLVDAFLVAWVLDVRGPQAGERGATGGPTSAPVSGVPGLSAGDGERNSAAIESALPPSAETRLVVHVTWERDGSPAADVELEVIAADQPDPHHRALVGRTDAQGCWTVDPAPAGLVAVASDRGDTLTGEVRAGETTDLRLTLAPGTEVRGVVVDPAGQIVPEAQLWLSRQGEACRGSDIVQTDSAGRFTLSGVAGPRWIGARRPGFTASELVEIGEAAPSELDVQLQLGPPGGEVAGMILGPMARPVGGALVTIGPEHGWPGADGHGHGPPPTLLITQPDGSFLAADVRPGLVAIGVVAAGFTPWTGWVDVVASESRGFRIQLDQGARIEGRVRDAEGAPMAGAVLSAGPDFGDIGWVQTTSDAAGRFVLADLPTGPQQVLARKSGVGEDKHTFHVVSGHHFVWDPVLTSGLQIIGRVVDESGAPVEGLEVMAQRAHSYDDERITAKVGATGFFALPDCEDVEHEVSVGEPGSSQPALAAVYDVRPGPDEVRVVITSDARAVASLVGRVVDERGRPPVSLESSLVPAGSLRGRSGRYDPSNGTLVFDAVRAGDYQLWVKETGRPATSLTVADLHAGEVRELGRIVLSAPGQVIAQLTLAPGLDPREVSCALYDLAGRMLYGDFGGAEDGLLERRSEPVAPGDYVLRAWGHAAPPVERSVHVSSGQDSLIELALEKGVREGLEFVVPHGEDRRVEVWLRDLDGALVGHQAVAAEPFPALAQSRALVELVVRPGRHALEVTLDGEPALQTEIDVVDGPDQLVEQSFTLP